MNNIKVVALSYKKTPIEIRELVALDEGMAKRLMELMKESFNIEEAFILSTCNRTEIYFSDDREDLNEGILKLLTVIKGDGVKVALPYFKYISDHQRAIKRLFEVAIGVHSKVVGDLQITHQVKKAYQWSVDTDMAGPQLHRLLHTIFYANKRVVQETAFRDGAASVSYAAKELAEQVVESLQNPVILVVGLGEIGSDFCGNIEGSHSRIVVANRTRQKSDEIALKYGYEVIPFEEMKSFAINEADVIVSSLSINQFVFNAAEFTDTLRQKCFIDLGVPRNVDPELDQLDGIIIYTIDELNAKATESQLMRLAAVEQVREIIDEELVAYSNWSRDMIVSPVIKKLKSSLEEIRKQEIAHFLKNATEKESKLVEKVTKSMMQKIIKLPVLQLKNACQRGNAENLIDVLNDLFDLEKQQSEAKS